jgi:predicted XRE-type DNA-binding protein
MCNMAETGYKPAPHDAAFRKTLLAKAGVKKAFEALEEEYTALHAMLDARQAAAMSKSETFASVRDALADTPGQAANLRARAELMQQIAAIVKESKWTQVEAAAQCGITQPRMNDLLRGRVSRFSLDALVNVATAIGRRVHLELELA